MKARRIALFLVAILVFLTFTVYIVGGSDDSIIVNGADVILTPPVGRKVGEALRQVQAFQHVRKTKGAEACPAGWEPGKPTLKIGPNLVVKVWEIWKPGE